MRWYQIYTELKHFIAGNRGPKIDKDVITIPLPEHVREELGADIHLLTVGLDQSKLGPIADVLGNHKN